MSIRLTFFSTNNPIYRFLSYTQTFYFTHTTTFHNLPHTNYTTPTPQTIYSALFNTHSYPTQYSALTTSNCSPFIQYTQHTQTSYYHHTATNIQVFMEMLYIYREIWRHDTMSPTQTQYNPTR